MPKNPSKVSDFADPSLASRRIAASTTRPHQGAFFLPFSFLSLHPFPLSLSLSHPVPSKTPYIPRLFSSHLISFHPLPSFSIYIAGRVRLIQGRHFPNASTFMRELEVDRRTILRDLDYLRDRMGLPIEYDASERGR